MDMMSEDHLVLQSRMLEEVQALEGYIKSLGGVEDPAEMIANINDALLCIEDLVDEFEEWRSSKDE